MLKKLPILFFILFSSQFAQEEQSENIDSLRIEHKYNLLFNKHPKLNLVFDLPGEFSNITSIDNYSKLSSFEMYRIKNNINQSFSVYRAGQKKYHLGVLSDVLGYVSTAAAAGFAAYHLYKYRKEYGIK